MGSSTDIQELEERLATLHPEAKKDRVRILNELAFALRVSEQWDRIQTFATEAAGLAQEIGDGPAEGRALATIAFVQYIRSDLKPALANCMQALRLATGDALVDAQIRVILGMVQWSLGNFDEALRHIERSLPVLREYNDRITEAFARLCKRRHSAQPRPI